jgi:hypothetical protein
VITLSGLIKHFIKTRLLFKENQLGRRGGGNIATKFEGKSSADSERNKRYFSCSGKRNKPQNKRKLFEISVWLTKNMNSQLHGLFSMAAVQHKHGKAINKLDGKEGRRQTRVW